MSLRLDKGKYYVLVYWDRDGKKRVQEYVGADERMARTQQVEVLRERVRDSQSKLALAEAQLKQMDGGE